MEKKLYHKNITQMTTKKLGGYVNIRQRRFLNNSIGNKKGVICNNKEPIYQEVKTTLNIQSLVADL